MVDISIAIDILETKIRGIQEFAKRYPNSSVAKYEIDVLADVLLQIMDAKAETTAPDTAPSEHGAFKWVPFDAPDSEGRKGDWQPIGRDTGRDEP